MERLQTLWIMLDSRLLPRWRKKSWMSSRRPGMGPWVSPCFPLDPVTFQSALIHLPCIIKIRVIITDQLTVTQHAICPVTSWAFPCQTMWSPTCVVWRASLLSAPHKWLKDTFLMLLKATKWDCAARKIASKLSDIFDSTIWFSSAMRQVWLFNLFCYRIVKSSV